MKRTFIILIVLICGLLDGGAAEVFWSPSKQLDLNDIGFSKYIIQATPSSERVFVLRETRSTNDKVDFIYESISYTGGAQVVQNVMLFDPRTSPFAITEIIAKGIQVRTSYSGWGGDDWQESMEHCVSNKLEFVFKKQNGEVVKITYEGAIENYSDVKKRFPDLPSRSQKNATHIKWSFGAIIQPKIK